MSTSTQPLARHVFLLHFVLLSTSKGKGGGDRGCLALRPAGMCDGIGEKCVLPCVCDATVQV